MKNYVGIIAALTLLLSGCGHDEETYRPAYFGEESASASSQTASSEAKTPSASRAPFLPAIPESVSSELSLTPRVTSEELSLTVSGVYSKGKFYAVEIVGKKLPEKPQSGASFGNFRLKASQNGSPTGFLDLEVPNGDTFLLMNSISDNLTYGCEVISNYRQFGAAEYPDIIELDFYIDGELEVPQYARFFAVLNGEIAEIPVYENGSPSKPRGTHLEPKIAGRMIQHLTVSTGIPDDYEIVKYEYIYDPENNRLNRKRVKFYGWEID